MYMFGYNVCGVRKRCVGATSCKVLRGGVTLCPPPPQSLLDETLIMTIRGLSDSVDGQHYNLHTSIGKQGVATLVEHNDV